MRAVRYGDDVGFFISTPLIYFMYIFIGYISRVWDKSLVIVQMTLLKACDYVVAHIFSASKKREKESEMKKSEATKKSLYQTNG